MKSSHACNEHPLSAGSLNTFIEYINDNSANAYNPRMGDEIEFMERAGLSSLLLIDVLGYYLQDIHSPLYPDRYYRTPGAVHSQSFVRDVAYQLREHYRRKWELPNLSSSDVRTETSGPPELLNSSDPVSGLDKVKPVDLSDDEIDKVIAYMTHYYPQVAEYAKALAHESQSLGYTGDHLVGRTSLVPVYFKDSVRAALGFSRNVLIMNAEEVLKRL